MSVTLGQALLLGFVQGLTEFLPVSSTAHLALAQRFLPGFSQPGILFDVLLHLGTLVAVTVYFRRRLLETARGLVAADPAVRRGSWKLVLLLGFAVAMTGLVTLPLKKLAEEGMSDFRRIGFALIGTAVLLTVTQSVGKRRGDGGRDLGEVGVKDAAIVGLLQSVSAIFHGFSRSGNTISMGLFSGLSRKGAAEFSFLLSIPTILGAATVECLSAWRHHPESFSFGGALPAELAGMAMAAVVGYLAVAVLLKRVVEMRLTPFIVYCGCLGVFLVAVAI